MALLSLLRYSVLAEQPHLIENRSAFYLWLRLCRAVYIYSYKRAPVHSFFAGTAGQALRQRVGIELYQGQETLNRKTALGIFLVMAHGKSMIGGGAILLGGALYTVSL
jgi:hypothetical protein